MRTRCRCPQMSGPWSARMGWILLLLALWLVQVQAMRESQLRELRKDTERMFYHGFDNYMRHAFPEDELRPLSCAPLTRDRDHPEHIELNDVLGNYSLTLIDSLSTLAILSSSETSGPRAWRHFQDGVRDLVKLYGDGSNGPAGQGERSRGFDMDSKVQVFETVIRGLGGLLSAHLFAVAELPIRGYSPPEEELSFARSWDKNHFPSDRHGITWSNGFEYDGQLLRLARDLGNRILPTFYTPTGLPYPRVNLRYGIPFYENSPLIKAQRQQNGGADSHSTGSQNEPEITETCSAGAGSLVLEFTTLSRLTGDGRYEDLAKRAFWAVWLRRSDIGLIGAGIDAESGRWVSPYTGIGAGIDSFFEYAFKSHVLLSSGERPGFDPDSPWSALDSYFLPLSEEQHSPEGFLRVWQDAKAAIDHHIYRGKGYQHPHLIQADIQTGATRAFSIDSLSAFYPGLLTLAGKVEDATEIHLLATALWTRFSALPERWNIATGNVDNGIGWWGGRPEFIESTYYLYRATTDPWYLHVGEMVLRDIKRRCWTRCGWAGLQDVRNGQLNDRMESFFLGETAKYLFLLFEPDHPLNKLDAPFVFSTEGHPLIVPNRPPVRPSHAKKEPSSAAHDTDAEVCEVTPPAAPFSFSSTAARPDIFHAASLARLHLMPSRNEIEGPIVEFAHDHPSVSLSDLLSPSNYTFYPWTLPPELVPYNAVSSPMSIRPTLDISFPNVPGTILGAGSLERVRDGILLKAIGGMRLGMVQDVPLDLADSSASYTEGFRIQVINNVPLGKDEKVYLSREITFDVLNPSDPNFGRVRDPVMLDIVIDVEPEQFEKNHTTAIPKHIPSPHHHDPVVHEESSTPGDLGSGLGGSFSRASSMKTALSALMSNIASILHDPDTAQQLSSSPKVSESKPPARMQLPAITSIGIGSAALPEVDDAAVFAYTGRPSLDRLSWSSIYVTDELCDHRLPLDVPRTYQILVVKRGGCSFSEKLRNIPAFPASASSSPSSPGLQLVIVVSSEEESQYRAAASSEDGLLRRQPHSPFISTFPPTAPFYPHAALFAEPFLVRPHLDEPQLTTGGFPRRNSIGLVMVGGGEETYALLRSARGVGIKERYVMRSQGVPITNLYII